MKYWWVNLGKSFERACKGGYLWSPQKSKDGKSLHFYTNMTKVSTGDIVFAYSDQRIKAIGTAQSSGYSANRPIEFEDEPWKNDGWKVDVEFTLLSEPIKKELILDKVGVQLKGEYQPINRIGHAKEGYLFEVNDQAGDTLLHIAKLQGSDRNSSKMKSEILDSLKVITDPLTHLPDERRPGDVNRKRTFNKGWKDATNKQSYQPNTLSKITWQNLGYRVGKGLGDVDQGTIDLIYQHLASTWDGKYFEPTDDEDTLKKQVGEYSKHDAIDNDEYEGPDKPPTQTKKTSTSFKRCPRVVAKVLNYAKGTCDLCLEAAPFNKSDGEPYLEVHHVVPLAQKGLDKTTNAVALCPNCHRRCHHSEDADVARQELYAQVNRLIESKL